MVSRELKEVQELNRVMDQKMEHVVIVYDGSVRVVEGVFGNKLEYWLSHSDPDGSVAIVYSQKTVIDTHRHEHDHEIFILRSGKIEIEMEETKEVITLHDGNDYRTVMHIIPANAEHKTKYAAGTKAYCIKMPVGR